MSLQVCCYCGWAKVTTHHGLRIHQGRMGCTPKGARVVEPQQQYTWGYVGPPEVQIDLKVDVYSSYKTETKVYRSDQSLQVCHCGWTKMTTYQGLRIHQGKMGCTAKGMRIPKKEQYDWDDEVDHNKYPQTKRTLPEAPRMSTRRDSAATTARMKEEYKPTPVVPPHSSHRATKSYPGQEKLSTHPQVNRAVREQATPASLKKNMKHQLLPQSSFSGDMGGVWSAGSNNDHAATFRIKEEPESSFAAPDVSLRSPAEMRPRPRLQDFSSDVQACRETPTASAVRPKERDRRDQTQSQSLVSEHPSITRSELAVRPKEKQRKDRIFSRGSRSGREQSSPPVVLPGKKDPPLLKMNQEDSDPEFVDEIQNNLQENKLREEMRDRNRAVKTAHQANLPVRRVSAPTSQRPAVQLKGEDMEEKKSQVNRSIREQLSAPPVVLPKKIDAPASVAKRSESLSLQEIQNMLQRKNKMREENRDIKPLELDSENVPVSPRINSPTTAAITEEKKPSFTPRAENPKSGHRLQDVSAAEQVSRPVRDQLPSPPVVLPKKKDSPLLMNMMNRDISDSEIDKEIHERIESPTKAAIREGTKSPSTPQHSLRKPTNPKSVHQLQDVSAAEQVNRSVMRHSNTPPEVPPKRKDSALFKIVKDTRFTPTKITSAEAKVSQEEDPASSHKASQSGLSTGLKVKELARMFSVTTAQEKAPRLKEKVREGHRLSQTRLPAHRFSAITAQKTTKEENGEELKTEKDVTRTSTITLTATAAVSKKDDPSSLCEAAQSESSTGMKVKELARMFSAQEAAVRPNRKTSQVKALAQRFLPTTAQGTAAAKEKNGEDEKPTQKTADSTSVDTKMNPAAADPLKEEPKSSCESTQLSGFSTGLKVKDLARMFSAAAIPEKQLGPRRSKTKHKTGGLDGKWPEVMKTVKDFSSSTLRSTRVNTAELN